MKSICFIVGAGEYSGRYTPDDDTYIIAADAGYMSLLDNGIRPDLVVGDFDSLGAAPDFDNIVTVPAEKNDTDMALAIKQGLAYGCKVFIIDGGIGGRLDHTLANIQLLKELNLHDAYGILLGIDSCITSITNGVIDFEPSRHGLISVFTLGNIADGVTLAGLKYPLDDYTMTDNYPIGVSNEFTDSSARISVKQGTLLICWESQPLIIKYKNLLTDIYL